MDPRKEVKEEWEEGEVLVRFWISYCGAKSQALTITSVFSRSSCFD